MNAVPTSGALWARFWTKGRLKLLIMLALATPLFGLAGAGIILVMYSVSYFSIGRDSPRTHGISANESSRLGGLMIALTLIFSLIVTATLTGYEPSSASATTQEVLWATVFICTLIGLAEDLSPDLLSPGLRLVLKLLLFASFLGFFPNAVPENIGVPGIDWLLMFPIVGLALCTLFCTAFINAFNMADGANGLASGIFIIFLYVLFMEHGRVVDGLLLGICALFFIFNIVSGRYFLGDAGSYGMGALIVCYGLIEVASGHSSAAFMAAILAYPCIDFAFSVIRRLAEGHSAFKADEGHLHNRVHAHLLPHFESKVLPNSLTGCSIAGASAGLALLVYGLDVIPIGSDHWWFVFLIELMLFSFVLFLTRKNPITR